MILAIDAIFRFDSPVYAFIFIVIDIFAISVIATLLSITKRLSEFSALRAMSKFLFFEVCAVVALSVFDVLAFILLLFISPGGIWYCLIFNLDVFLVFYIVERVFAEPKRANKSQKDLESQNRPPQQ